MLNKLINRRRQLYFFLNKQKFIQEEKENEEINKKEETNFEKDEDIKKF